MILMMIHEPWIQGWIRAHSSFEESAQLWLLDHFTVLQDSDWTKVPSFGWSCLKNPKWRIREAQVSFLSVGDVLCWHLKLGITLLSKKYHINVRKLAQRLAQLATNFQGLEICPSPVFNEINSKSQVTKCLLCRLLHRNHNILRSCTIWKSGTATRKGISLHWHWILIGYWSGIDWFLWCVCQIQLVSMTRAMFTCNNTSIREGIRRFVGTRLTVTDPGGGIDSLLSLGCTTFWWVSSLGCITFWWGLCKVENLCWVLEHCWEGGQRKGLEQQNVTKNKNSALGLECLGQNPIVRFLQTSPWGLQMFKHTKGSFATCLDASYETWQISACSQSMRKSSPRSRVQFVELGTRWVPGRPFPNPGCLWPIIGQWARFIFDSDEQWWTIYTGGSRFIRTTKIE